MLLLDNNHIEKGNNWNFQLYLKTAYINYSTLQTMQWSECHSAELYFDSEYFGLSKRKIYILYPI